MGNKNYIYTERIHLIFQWLVVKSKRLVFLLILAVLLITAVSCSNNSSDISSGISFFTVWEPVREQMLAELQGKLVLENGCLRIIDDYNTSYLIIWPYGFSLRRDGEEIQIINDRGQIVAHVGDYIYVSGGEQKAREHIEKDVVKQQLPDDCQGPYWIVGEFISVINN